MGIGIFTPKVSSPELESVVSTMPVAETAPLPVIDMVRTLDGSNQEIFSPSQAMFDVFDQKITQAENRVQAASFNGGPTAVIIEKSSLNLPVLALAAAGLYFFFWRKK